MDLDDKLEMQYSSELTLNNVMVEGSSQANLLTSTSKLTNNFLMPTNFLCQNISCSTLRGLVTKNVIKLIRNPSVLLMMIILPILMVVAFYLACGKRGPHDIPFGIVNDELKMMLEHCPAYDQGDWYLKSIL